MRALAWLGLVVAGWPSVVAADAAFREVAAAAGLEFVHSNGMSGKLYFAEHMGGSVALLDYDNDGDLDVYLGQSGPIDETPPEAWIFPPAPGQPMTDRLFRNDLTIDAEGGRHLHFTDVTRESGLDAPGYSMGVATADYDGDGWMDLYITNLGANQLWRNRGDGTFEDVTARAQADDRRWSVAASFFDYDGDGWLDLYIGNYVDFRVATHKRCASPTGQFDYCGPRAFESTPNRLLRNRGDGTFQDVSEPSGILGVPGATLGTVAADFNGDGLMDLYVANDQAENEMLINQGDGTFVNDALLSGTAVDAQGQPQASMGVVAADLTGDGFVDLFMSHLDREMNTLYVNDGSGMFDDVTRDSGLGMASWSSTGFGTAVLDYDGDTVLDLFVANGAVLRIEAQLRAGNPYPLEQKNQLWRGLGGGRFAEVPDAEREEPVYSEVSRGTAKGDLDNDGDADLVIANNSGPVRLMLNQRRPGGDWIGLRLLSADGKRYLPGARVALITADGSKRWRWARTDGSYASANDPRVRFALLPGESAAGAIRGFEVVWPDGSAERFAPVPTGEYVDLRRGSGTALEPGAPAAGAPTGG